MNLKDQNLAIKKMISAAYVKVYVNYSQTIAIINTLQLNWDQQISDIFNVHKVVSGGVQQVIGLECLIQGQNFFFFFLNY